MPNKNKYIIKMIREEMNEYGKYYNGGASWGGINNAMDYDLEYINHHLILTIGVHEVLKIEQDGALTHIR